ncbi:MAG: hypothetical protein WKF97_03640 [Chitinophagaceae bacterium]
MYSYELLEPGCYYLIQEKENLPVTMIKVSLESDHCMYISVYGESETIVWKRKTDHIHDIVELLSDNKIKEWESLYNNNEDAFNYEEGEE